MDRVLEEVQGFVKGVVHGLQAQALRDAAKDLDNGDGPLPGGGHASVVTWLQARASTLEGK